MARPFFIRGITHVVALLVGWGAWSVWRPSSATDGGFSIAGTKPRLRSMPGALSAEDVFATITTTTPAATALNAEEKNPADTLMTEALKLAATMPPPEDFERALAEEIKSWNGNDPPNAKTYALMYRWMLKDSTSLSRWAGTDEMDLKYRALLTLRYAALSDARIPLPDRIAIIQATHPQVEPAQKLCDQLAANDVGEWMKGPADFNFQFRSGELDASQILARMEKEMPELSKKSPAVVRDEIFQSLVRQNPHAAMPLLDQLAPAERSAAVLRVARTNLDNVNPDLFLAALKEVPAGDATLREDRLRAWTSRAENTEILLNTEYVDWIRALPDGVDREMALYSLSAAIEKRRPELAASLRDELKDPELKQRLTAEP